MIWIYILVDDTGEVDGDDDGDEVEKADDSEDSHAVGDSIGGGNVANLAQLRCKSIDETDSDIGCDDSFDASADAFFSRLKKNLRGM